MTGPAVEVDPDRPHRYVPPILARSRYCAVCGKPAAAGIHLIAESARP